MRKKPGLTRILVYLFILAVFFGGTGYAAWKGYRSVRQARLVKQAQAYLAASDVKKALLCLRRALGHNSKDVAAARLMADVAERTRSPAALMWRSRVVELAPSSTDDRLALARTAMIFRDLTTLSNALEGVSRSATNTAAYNNLAGGLAIASGQLAAAEAHFLQASRLEPTNRLLQLNLAVVKLPQTNIQAVTEARSILRNLTNDPALSSQALRELVGDAVRQGHTNDLLPLIEQLVRDPNSVFADKLLELDFLHATKNPRYEECLGALRREAAGDPGQIFQLAMWTVPKRGPADALSWLETLPLETKTNQPVALLSAQCRTALQDWRGLQTSLETQNWAEVDFIRHAFQARALRGQELDSSAKTEWEQAFKGANGRSQSLLMLLQLAGGWNWLNEQEQLLWAVVNQFPGEKWAQAALAELLYARGRTQGLLALFGQLAKANPSDLSLKNNLAATGLLLNAPQVKPFDLAREVYEKAPTNAAYVSTYAYSLYVQEKREEALQVIEKLPPADLERPSIAAYYGVLLHAAGQSEKARKYLDLTSKATLLPEERALVEKARSL